MRASCVDQRSLELEMVGDIHSVTSATVEVVSCNLLQRQQLLEQLARGRDAMAHGDPLLEWLRK